MAHVQTKPESQMLRNIFIIDDNREVLELTKSNLKHLPDTAIRTFINPFQALKKIDKKGVPDLVITDLRMKKMNGIEFITRICERFSTNFIIFTGDAATLPPSCHYHTVFKDAGGFEKLVTKVEELLLVGSPEAH